MSTSITKAADGGFGRKYQEWQNRYRGCTEYTAYFTRIWGGRKEEWAMCMREKDSPSGDQTLEGYHHRLQKHTFKGLSKMDLLSAVACLDQESRPRFFSFFARMFPFCKLPGPLTL